MRCGLIVRKHRRLSKISAADGFQNITLKKAVAFSGTAPKNSGGLDWRKCGANWPRERGNMRENRHIIPCGGLKVAGASPADTIVLPLNLWSKRDKNYVELKIEDLHTALLK